MTAPLLSVEGVSVDLPTPRGPLRAVDNVDLSLAPGRTLGVVGESGCGKTVTARSVLKLIDMPPGRFEGGQILWQGRDLIPLDNAEMDKIRAREIAIIFQEPMTSLNPVYTVGQQIAEVVSLHEKLGKKQAIARAVEMLRLVNIPNPQRRVHDYPHQFSGGMRQRVMIAMALACSPKLLIADEPTTALDVTIQAQILDLLAREQRRRRMAMILITHDLGVLAGRTDEVAVMYAGRVVERAPTPLLFANMRMPYTEALLAAIPRLDAAPHAPLPTVAGRPPDPTRRILGCAFAPRCKYAVEHCRREAPPLAGPEPDHRYACWLPLPSQRISA